MSTVRNFFLFIRVERTEISYDVSGTSRPSPLRVLKEFYMIKTLPSLPAHCNTKVSFFCLIEEFTLVYITWEQAMEDSIPFTLGYGRSSQSSCRGCRRVMEKTELRVQTRILFEAAGIGPRPVKINFCVNKECIAKGIERYMHKVRNTEI